MVYGDQIQHSGRTDAQHYACSLHAATDADRIPTFLGADRLLITLLHAHSTAECRTKQDITAEGNKQTHRRTALGMFFHASVAHLPLAIPSLALLQIPAVHYVCPSYHHIIIAHRDVQIQQQLLCITVLILHCALYAA